MERIIIRVFCILILYLCLGVNSFANPPAQTTTTPLGIPQNVTLPQCVKTFNIGYEKLFLLTEAAINHNNFNIEEIQSQGGYIVFSYYQYKFLATVFTFGSNKAILKITPCNNNYTFPPLIIRNVFNYIAANQYKKF